MDEEPYGVPVKEETVDEKKEEIIGEERKAPILTMDDVMSDCEGE